MTAAKQSQLSLPNSDQDIHKVVGATIKIRSPEANPIIGKAVGQQPGAGIFNLGITNTLIALPVDTC